MAINEVKSTVGKRQPLAIGDHESADQPVVVEVLAREPGRRRGEIDAGQAGAARREASQVDAGAAADFENRSPAVAVKVDEPEQVMELFEMILIEIVEEPARADRMRRDVEIVNM